MNCILHLILFIIPVIDYNLRRKCKWCLHMQNTRELRVVVRKLLFGCSSILGDLLVRSQTHSVSVTHEWQHPRPIILSDDITRERERKHAHRLLPSAGEEKKPREEKHMKERKWTDEWMKTTDSQPTGMILTITKPPNPQLTVSCSSKHTQVNSCVRRVQCVQMRRDVKSYTTHSFQTPANKTRYSSSISEAVL